MSGSIVGQTILSAPWSSLRPRHESFQQRLYVQQSVEVQRSLSAEGCASSVQLTIWEEQNAQLDLRDGNVRLRWARPNKMGRQDCLPYTILRP
jgi:hypothetical protein